MVKKCPKCNHFVSDITQTCPHCGAPMNAAPVADEAEREPQPAVQPEEPEKNTAPKSQGEEPETKDTKEPPKPLVGAGWGAAADRVFWCVVAFTVTGVLSIAFDFFAVSSVSSDWLLLFTHRERLAEEASALLTVSTVMKVALAVCFCFYMSALGRFEREQPTQDDAGAVATMRLGVILQFLAFLLMQGLPFMWQAAPVIVLLLFVLLVVAYSMKRGGSKRLNYSDSFTDQTRRGAEDLRFSAVCNINILLTPVVLLVIMVLIILGTFGSMPSLGDALAVFALAIGKIKGIVNLNSSEIGHLDGIIGAVMLIFGVAGMLCLVWGIIALAYPIRGWNRIRKAAEPAKAAPEPEEVVATPAAPAAPVSPEPAPSAPVKDDVPAASPTEEDDSHVGEAAGSKKKYYIAGGVLLAALLAGGVFLLFGKSSLKITDYAVSMAEDGDYTFYANTTGEAIPTGITLYGLSATILDQHDYDDDGNIEALVLVNGGGNAHEPYPFVIYYDQDTKTFRQTEEFEMPYGIVEEIDGQWSFIQRNGLRQTNYVFEDHEVKVAEESFYPFGDAFRKYPLSAMFYNDDAGDKTIMIDLDDDGKDERLLVHRGFSHAEGNGEYMNVEEIQWTNGRTLKSVIIRNDNPIWNYNIYGAEIAVLQSKTNGMHDILTDSIHYHRWNGSTYREWTWDGTQLVCTDTSEGQYEAMPTWDGDYRFTGIINNQWHFDMWLNIEGSHVWGQYLVHEGDNGYVALDGTIDTDGSIRMDEHYPDGGATGYYFQGTFSSERITGKYLSTQRSINMDFYAY